MYSVYLAFSFSILAFFTGVMAIGSGKHFQFHKRDILKGRRNAILYVWVTLSTMFSLGHTAAVYGYIMEPQWGDGPAIQMWFMIHWIVGCLLIAAHLYIHLALRYRAGSADDYLWGTKPLTAPAPVA